MQWQLNRKVEKCKQLAIANNQIKVKKQYAIESVFFYNKYKKTKLANRVELWNLISQKIK